MKKTKPKRPQEWHEGLTREQAAEVSAAAQRGDLIEAKRLMLAAGKEWHEAVERLPGKKVRIVRHRRK